MAETGTTDPNWAEAVRQAFASACADNDRDRIEQWVGAALAQEPSDEAGRQAQLRLLHEMLQSPQHFRHQELVFGLQQQADPSSAPVLRRLFEWRLDWLAERNCSDKAVVAKWFSHAWGRIGTPEAMRALHDFSAHPDPGVAAEMRYRLQRLAE